MRYLYHGPKPDLCNLAVFFLTPCRRRQGPSASINNNLWALYTNERITCTAGWLTLPQPHNHVPTLQGVSSRYEMSLKRNAKEEREACVYVSTDLSTSILLGHFRQKLAWLPPLAMSLQTQLLIQCRPVTALKNLCEYATVADTTVNFRLLGKEITTIAKEISLSSWHSAQAFTDVDTRLNMQRSTRWNCRNHSLSSQTVNHFNACKPAFLLVH